MSAIATGEGCERPVVISCVASPPMTTTSSRRSPAPARTSLPPTRRLAGKLADAADTTSVAIEPAACGREYSSRSTVLQGIYCWIAVDGVDEAGDAERERVGGHALVRGVDESDGDLPRQTHRQEAVRLDPESGEVAPVGVAGDEGRDRNAAWVMAADHVGEHRVEARVRFGACRRLLLDQLELREV